MVETSSLVPVDDLNLDPYKALIAYPTPTVENVQLRISQLRDLGVTGIEFEGPLRMGKLSVLGKGVVGMVFSGKSGPNRVAVKIRRVDSRRGSMRHEADMIQAANNAGIGPEFMGASNDVLTMQFVEGQTLRAWLSSLKGRGTRARVRSTFKTLFQECARLDAYGIDHGELSRAHKNVLVTADDHPWVLDFESASLMRRPNNFTSIAQYLFLSGRFAKHVSKVLGPTEVTELLKYLRLYKRGMTNDGFEAVSKMLRFSD